MANIFQEQITPELPKSLGQERVFVYIPKASYSQSGIASYSSDDFAISPDGQVTSKQTKIYVNNVLQKTIYFTSDPQTQLNSLDERLDTAEGDIDALEGRMSTAESDIDALEGRATGIESDISDLQSVTRQNANDIDVLEGRMTTAESDIDALEGRMTTAESDIDALEDRMTTDEGRINTNANNITDINSKIPNEASSSNKLADKDFVNSSINNMAAFYITYNAQGEAFPTHSALFNATTYYSGGEERTPTRNDYAIVRADETQSGATTRYTYQNNQWEFQYVVNETPMTAQQLAALNSGITADMIPTEASSTNQLADKTFVTNITNPLSNNIADLQERMTDAEGNISTLSTAVAGKANASVAFNVQLLATGWSNNKYTLSASDLQNLKTANNKLAVDYYNGDDSITSDAYSNLIKDNNYWLSRADIYRVIDNGTTVTLVANEAPAQNLYIQVEVYS